MLNYIIPAIIFVAVISLRIVKEYERGIKFTLGKFTSIMKPGLNFIIPVLQTYTKVDIRVRTVDVPDQEAITKDNVSARINAVIYYNVSDTKKAIIEVEDFIYAVGQLAQTTMRNIVGEVTLDELLGNRDMISKKIKKIIDEATDPWGIRVTNCDLKDIQLPQEMKRVIAKEAESEREKRAVIIRAQGEVDAADNMAKAATMLSKAPGALHIRTLQSLNNMSSDKSNTVVFAMPVEILEAFKTLKK